MKIMIPLADGQLTAHFGHCQEFACLEVNKEQKEIVSDERLPAPPHKPGLLPTWLVENGANLIIAGGMGQMARDILTGQGIEVIVGAPEEAPSVIVEQWLAGKLDGGTNACDH
jgi:predicted Fe-Mo cluster-binding NifX family protein